MAAAPDLARFRRILEAARTRTASLEGHTLIPQAHLAQMRLFMLRQGVEFFPKQDSFGARRQFMQRVIDYNKLPSRLGSIVDSFLCDGHGLLYFRPSKDLYRIHYFREEQFRCYSDEDGDLNELIIIYSFKVRPPRGFGAQLTQTQQYGTNGYSINGPSNATTRWIRLEIHKDRIIQSITNEKPDFEGLPANKATVVSNPLGFIPAVEVFNGRSLEEGQGQPEFDWMAGHILEHDKMTRSIKGNLSFFGSPTLVSSRPKHDLMEADDDGDGKGRITVSSSSGFSSLSRPSSRVSEPLPNGGGLRVPRVIANVEAADRVQFITPDAVAGDLTSFTAMYQEQIRMSLGGVDDLSINSGATAYEVRTLYGRVAATAKSKCLNLFDYGFCQLFQLMVAHEESLFRESLAQALGIKKPEPPLEENLPPEQAPKIQQLYNEERAKWNNKVGQAIAQIKETGQVPPQVVGLLPDGDTAILWRWQGEVFEDSKEELLQASIVCRNLQELGVDSLEALQYLFPAKTPEERSAMLGGYPFRIAEATQRSVGIYIDTIRAFFQTPHPQEPDLPLAADPNLDLTPFLYRTLAHLRTELNYGGRYSDTDGTVGVRDTLDDADRYRSTLGLPTAADRRDTERRSAFARLLAAGPGPVGPTGQLGFGSGPGSMGAGVPGGDGRASYADSPEFGAGGVLGYDPIGPELGASAQLGATGGFGPGPGDPDLLAPTNPGVLRPTEPPGVRTPVRKRGVRTSVRK